MDPAVVPEHDLDSEFYSSRKGAVSGTRKAYGRDRFIERGKSTQLSLDGFSNERTDRSAKAARKTEKQVEALLYGDLDLAGCASPTDIEIVGINSYTYKEPRPLSGTTLCDVHA